MHTPTNFDQTDRSRTAPALRYDGAGPLVGIPSRNDIVAEFDNGVTAILQQSLSGKQPIHFMPTEVSDDIEGYSSYILRITGSLINGQKAVVNITGIRPFFDVEVPENHSPSSLKTILACILSVTLKNTTKFGFEDIRAFPLQGYHTEKKAYIHVRTWNHFDRYNALKAVRGVGIHTASDDLNCQYYYRKVAHEERLLLSSWAVLSNYLYEFTPDVHWKDDPEPLKQICLVDVETAPEPAPDIHIGFNDSQYDWRFIVEKANKLGVLEWMFNHISFKPSSLEKIIKWEYRYNMIKVNDGKFHSKHLKILGCVAIDVRPCFMGIYSKAEKSSLAFYLNECGLESKMDMPIHRMNKYYERALKEPDSMSAEQMREVVKYCIIDALSCQRLMVKHNAINEYREVASVAFLSLFDAHYFAGGMKVCNLLSASAWQRGILTSMISNQQTETGKYPGAYVFPPVKGLENRRPVTGLDFASLYPSLIITYNLSPDKIILSQERAEQSGKKLHKISFKFNNQDCLAWSIQHNNIPEEKGLYAIMLEYLSSKRNEMKKRLAPLKEKKEDMELVIASMGKGLSLPEAIEKDKA
ncbi:ribonuclease H-like domain-containing protein [Rhizophagus clarus]|uniref:DNA-directed DNA polymerase n=1 Tax=Rhizophagus clarus TaxID=94130 RepID=A0A8H3L243_9GLOM|nr:ribonuclease H-like domain-containing protein [Rhizophagus clarus]